MAFTLSTSGQMLTAPPEFYITEDAIRKANLGRGQFKINHPESGLKIDVIIPKWDAFDASRFSRVRRIRPSEESVASFASSEDAILKKLVFHEQGGSEKHLRDIGGMVKISTNELDFAYLHEGAKNLDVDRMGATLLHELNIGDLALDDGQDPA